MSLKLVHDQVVDHEPLLLPALGLGRVGKEVATDLGVLVSGFHLEQNDGNGTE